MHPELQERNEYHLKMAQIEAFCTVIQTGSISQAARYCHISQPAVSMQVRDLEQYCQQRLLKRSNKGVTPTPAGWVVYEYCKKIIHLKQDLKLELKQFQHTP
ncbi:MAG TPA: LysR family transcriptional regulator [Oscillospiraceae bacterium]|nr:LysR family transcriptional regulator [Oscillospiraceae bacterium]